MNKLFRITPEQISKIIPIIDFAWVAIGPILVIVGGSSNYMNPITILGYTHCFVFTAIVAISKYSGRVTYKIVKWIEAKQLDKIAKEFDEAERDEYKINNL